MTRDRDGRLRAAEERLELAMAAYRLARAADDRAKTPATKTARDAALLELKLATKQLAELKATEFGL